MWYSGGSKWTVFVSLQTPKLCRQQQYNSSINVNKTSDPWVSNYEHLHVRYRLTYIFSVNVN